MIYGDYMLYPVMWEKTTGQNPDTRSLSYAEPIEIKVLRYGSFVLNRDANSSTQVSAQRYLTIDDVCLGDKLNGQVVKYCEPVPEFDDSSELREVACG